MKEFRESLLPQGLMLLWIWTLGCVCQILLFKTATNTFLNALLTNQWLWVLYTFGGAITFERAWNQWQRNKSKDKPSSSSR